MKMEKKKEEILPFAALPSAGSFDCLSWDAKVE